MDTRTVEAVEAADARLDAKAVAAVVLGNALEFYDFIAYSLLAKQIGDAYFPSGNPTASLLSSLLVFWVGFFTRPLGAAVIGAYADRAGRKPAMLLTIGLMALGMLMLAATPRFDTIGWAAPAIVVAGRLIQGFALGGEVGPTTAYLLEAAPAPRRALFASWQLASQGLAQLIAGVIGYALAVTLGDHAMAAWGWRVPFFLGVAIVPVGLFIRNALPETAGEVQADAPASLGEVLRRLGAGHGRTLVLGILMIMASTIATYVLINMTTYANVTLGLSFTVATGATVVLGVTGVVFSVVGGWLADRVGRRPLMLWSRAIVAVAAVPAFLWMVHAPSAWSVLTITFALSTVTAFAGAGSIAGIPEALPRAVRSAGLAIAYALSVTLFGGSTQWVINKLIAVTGNPLAPAYYLAVVSAVGAAAALLMPETRGRELD